MDLNILWFILIAVLFAGFFFLEGFDYGVGILLPFAGKNDTQRRILIQTIAPVWDGNEVWMITAGGALFAAFPHAYATMFSSFYLALFLMLVALIFRGVALDFRSKHEDSTWRSTCDWLIFFGSAVPALLWGVAVTNLLQGIALNAQMHYLGTFFDLLTPYTLVGGVTFLLVFTFHGASYLTLKVASSSKIDELRLTARKVGILATVSYVICLALTYTKTDAFSHAGAPVLFLLAAAVFVGANLLLAARHYGKAFILSAAAIIFTTAAFFAALFPRIIVSSVDPAYSLTIYNASSTPYTLSIMTVAALCLVPVVLIYQGWTYWIFRKRIDDKHLEY